MTTAISNNPIAIPYSILKAVEYEVDRIRSIEAGNNSLHVAGEYNAVLFTIGVIFKKNTFRYSMRVFKEEPQSYKGKEKFYDPTHALLYALGEAKNMVKNAAKKRANRYIPLS